MRIWTAVLLHFIFLSILFFGYRCIRGYPLMSIEKSQVFTDTEHYEVMKEKGYSNDDKATNEFIAKYGTNTAFFPGFPYMWRHSHLNRVGVSILNLSLFLLGLLLLAHHFKLNVREVLLFLSLPTQFFFYVPYSESLFFLCTALILIGYRKNSIALGIAGFFTASFTRSASNIFLPAIIITEWLSGKFKVKQLILLILASLSALVVVMFLQYYQSGDALAFISAQKYWGHKLQWPNLPFTTWGDMLLLDAGALVIGVFAVCFILWVGWQKVINRKVTLHDKAIIFSLSCLSGLTLLALAFKGGLLFSLNRYLFPTAFLLIGGSYLYRNANNFTKKQVLNIGIGILVFTSLFHFFSGLLIVLKFLALTIYLTLYLISAKENQRPYIISTTLYCINCCLQIFLLHRFLAGIWVA